MPARLSSCSVLLMGGALLGVWSATAAAQSSFARPMGNAAAAGDKTLLSVELLIDQTGGGLEVHQWNKVFRDLGVTVRIRRGLPGEETGVTEQSLGTLRQVRVLGRLDRHGRIVLPGHTFSPTDAAQLAEWIRELKTFGAQGNPEGQPLWGLSKVQFGQVYAALSEKTVESETAGQSLGDALTALKLPEQYPLRWTLDAQNWLRDELVPGAKVRQEVQGLSQGTALAMLLNEFGLGFYPLRTPTGSIELGIDPHQTNSKLWPVGWEPKDALYQTAPALFQLVPVELSEAPLLDVLAAVEQKSEVPVRIDHHLIEKHQIDLAAIRVSYPPKKTSWNLLVRGVTNPHRLSHDLRIDEQGHPFLWVTTLKLGKIGR